MRFVFLHVNFILPRGQYTIIIYVFSKPTYILRVPPNSYFLDLFNPNIHFMKILTRVFQPSFPSVLRPKFHFAICSEKLLIIVIWGLSKGWVSSLRTVEKWLFGDPAAWLFCLEQSVSPYMPQSVTQSTSYLCFKMIWGAVHSRIRCRSNVESL